MKIIKIKAINHKQRESQGGKTFTSCGVLIDSAGGEIWLSGFGSPQTRSWSKGQRVAVTVEQKGEYWNFTPIPADVLMVMMMEKNGSIPTEKPVLPVEKQEIRAEDIPW